MNDLIASAQIDVVKPLTEWQVSYLMRNEIDKAIKLQVAIDVVNKMCGVIIANDSNLEQLRTRFDALRESSNEVMESFAELKKEVEQQKFFIQK